LPRNKTFKATMGLVLAILLVTIQQFGFAHALTHLRPPAPTGAPKSDVPHPAEKVCLECAAFVQLGASLTGHVVTPVIPVAAIGFAVVPLVSHAATFAPYFRPRAPPLTA
jgi:hypothetical protein